MARPRALCLFIVGQIIIIWLHGFELHAAEYHVDMDVNAHSPGGPFAKFWSSTGFSPPGEAAAKDFLLSDEMRLNLALIGSLPQRAVRQVRVHWLLSLVRVSDTEGDILRWDFSQLDKFLDQLVLNRLHPGFELMGVPAPAGTITNLSDARQAAQWQQLVTDCIMHCSARYGREEVSSWRFETWNEPDLKQYNTLNWTLNGYLSYLDRTVLGVRGAQRLLRTRLRLGGPAGTFKSCRRHPICWAVLQRLSRWDFDFVSFHRKGVGSSQSLVDGTMTLLDEITRKFPNILGLPIANDEADSLTGWWRIQPWRGDVRYAGMVVSAAIDIHSRWTRNNSLPRLELFGNDNGFLESQGSPQSRFKQRTLLASFRAHGKPTQLIRKPVMTSMAFLSLAVGLDLPLKLHVRPPIPPPLRFSIIGTLREDLPGSVVSLLSTFHNESTACLISGSTAPSVKINLTISGITDDRFSTAKVRVLEVMGDAMATWERAGSPEYPDPALLRALRRREGPRTTILPQTYPLGLELPLCSVKLLQICSMSPSLPPALKSLRVINITFNEVLLLWSDDSLQKRCLLTFEVAHRPDSLSTLKTIGAMEWTVPGVQGTGVFYTAFLYSPAAPAAAPAGLAAAELTRGQYAVRAVDLWDRPGPYSYLSYPSPVA